MNSILSVSKLTKKFGKFTAVNNISFDLKEGEILGLLGANGAGKTTTIQMLLGVLNPTSGKVVYFGQDLKDNRREILEQVNFSSAYTYLPWFLTVFECLHFISYLYNIPDRRSRIQKVIDLFRLQDILKKQIADLSAGQMTRVNLAKAFINFPKVILLDEPTASLDVEVAEHIREFLLTQRKEYATSIILTSHNMGEVEELCDRVIVINNGKIVDDATPDQLASKIKVAHIELFIKDGIKRTIQYCKKYNIAFQTKGRNIIIDVAEKNVHYFLKNLIDQGIEYEQISIEQPTLEDYFLSVLKK